MDLPEHHDLIFGEEFCFPATTTYYPPLYAPTGINVPTQLYQQQTSSRCDNQAQSYMGHKVQGTSSMYYVVPNYGIEHSPHGSHPLHPCAIGDGRFVRTQEYHAETVEHTYHQPIPMPYCSAHPSAADRTPASTAQSLGYTNGLFVPGGLRQTVSVTSERGVAWNQSLQQATIASMEFQSHTSLPKEQPRRPAPWKRQLSGGARAPARLPVPRARRAPHQSPQAAAPSARSSLQANLSYNNEASNVGSDLCGMQSTERSQPYARTSSYANRRFSSMSQQNTSKAKKPIGSMPPEITVKSYTSRLLIGNPEGKIVIRSDHYNRHDFQVVYPNAKFFVIKSYDEADIHKSIKYGVWSTSSIGSQKLDFAFREAQAIAASSSTLCPVFLFFSVNASYNFCGVAEMVGPVDYQNDMDFWCMDKWIGSFPVKWHIIKNVHNSTFRSILLQNNEDKPVTSSRDTQEIHYTPGTTMLELFKYTRADGCVLDSFMVHEEKEARRLQKFKLRRSAPHFIPAWHGPRPSRHVLPKSECVVMDKITSETNNLTDKLQSLNLEKNQASWQDFGNLTSIASTTNRQKEWYCYGTQAHGKTNKNTAKAIPSPARAYHPMTPTIKKYALDGEQRCWKKVQIAPTENPHPETVAIASSKAPPEEHQQGGENTLAHSLSGDQCEEQKIVGKACPPAPVSTSKACSEPLPGMLAIGSMLVPITTSS
ncbi:uncharacterized protein LOC8071196 [Sorghum bicolor]|uniref:YTH domain-containing family protein n=1 Tax=Sorghum bicolor TaxID=4558 RepID=A0A1Z5R230_SORBI|nr:uncharacterized protein LOC8071196 [Sorghum bicolor]OQU77485.1 hypothetical protein SORBI_3009G054400 [Sorghum bicolor]OQU77487.1 hypothetical protein SORBI_3009G054400 [Sorghum bicolor]|eukprot:XP_002440649.2 uncharacterized protein LOC8071196 [Sorghum bicolor]